MTVYFTADLHIGHEKVEQTRRPQVTQAWQANPRRVGMRHDMIVHRNLCNLLTKRDQLWVLGDISAGGSQAQRDALLFLSTVREETGAEMHLIPGNHDGCHPQFRTAKKWWPAYLEVFDTIMPFASRKIAGHKVCLSHYPYFGDHTEEDRHTQWRLRDEGRWLLHGHTHQRFALTAREWSGPPWGLYSTFTSMDPGDPRVPERFENHRYRDADGTAVRVVNPGDLELQRTINVGLDAWDLGPVSLEAIAGVITKLEGRQ